MDKDSTPIRWSEAVAAVPPEATKHLHSAIDAVSEGREFTTRELGAVRKVLRHLNTDVYESLIAIATWVEWAGEPRQTVVDRSNLLGLPVEGGVSLPEFVRTLYALVDRHLDALTGKEKPSDAAENGRGPASPFLELGRQERWRILRLERQKREGNVVSVSFMRASMGIVTSSLQRLAERLRDMHGAAAYALLEETLATIARAVEDMYMEGQDEDDAAMDAASDLKDEDERDI